MGVLKAAVSGLTLSQRRRAALMRHIWRPARFRALLERFAGPAPLTPAQQALLTSDAATRQDAPHIGLRSGDEVRERIAWLRAEIDEPPLPAREVAALEDILAVNAMMPAALQRLRDISVDLPALTPALDRVEARIAALAARGVDVAALRFEASYGRTSMEYYDGFVFGFTAERRADVPAVATGGRYDALTRHLGGGAECPAVGGVLRPDIMLDLEASG